MTPARGRPSLRPDACRNIAWQPEGWKIKKKKKKKRDTNGSSGRPCMSESLRSAILTITVPLATNPSPPSSSGSTTPLTTCAGPTSPSFRVLTERRRGSGLRKRPAGKVFHGDDKPPEPAEVEESSDEDEEAHDWVCIEVTKANLARSFPEFRSLRGADVCVLAAAYPDVELAGHNSIGWRGQITGVAGIAEARKVQVFSSWFKLNDASIIRPLKQE